MSRDLGWWGPVAVLVTGLLLGCSDDGPDVGARATVPGSTTTTPGPGPSLEAAVERSRLFAADRLLEVLFVNHGPAGRQLTTYRLESPLFAPIPAHRRTVTLRPDGGLTSAPMPYGQPRCDGDTSAGTSSIVAVVDGEEVRLEVDDAPLRQQHEAECAEGRVHAAVALRFGSTWDPGADGTVVGELELDQRATGVAAVVDEMAGTVIFSLRFEDDLGQVLRVDDDHRHARVRVVVSVSGCSAHALIESKKSYRFPTWISLDGAAPARVEVEPEGPARAALEALLASCEP